MGSSSRDRGLFQQISIIFSLWVLSNLQSALVDLLLLFYLQWTNYWCWEWPVFRPLCSWGRCLDGSLLVTVFAFGGIETNRGATLSFTSLHTFLVLWPKALSMIKLKPAWTFQKLNRHSSPPLSPGAQAPKPVVHVTHLKDVPLLCRLLWPGRVCHRIGL